MIKRAAAVETRIQAEGAFRKIERRPEAEAANKAMEGFGVCSIRARSDLLGGQNGAGR